jgi:hypothetical protein
MNRTVYCRERREIGFFRTLRGSGSEQHATAEEIEVGSAVHLALDQLELVDLAFRLTATPRHGERGPDRRFILL